MKTTKYALMAAFTTAALQGFTGVAFAAADEQPLNVVSSITVDAPPSVVWAKIKNFDSLAKWHPAVASSPDDKGNHVGSVRKVELKGGGALEETLESYGAEGRTYSYRAKDGGALPVANYHSVIAVSGAGSKSRVEWRGSFTAAPGQSSETAVKAVNGVYEGGLGNIKKMAEQK